MFDNKEQLIQMWWDAWVLLDLELEKRIKKKKKKLENWILLVSQWMCSVYYLKQWIGFGVSSSSACESRKSPVYRIGVGCEISPRFLDKMQHQSALPQGTAVCVEKLWHQKCSEFFMAGCCVSSQSRVLVFDVILPHPFDLPRYEYWPNTHTLLWWTEDSLTI